MGHKFSVLEEKKITAGGYREEAVCPVCGSFDRERLVYLYLLNKTDLFEKPKNLLHIAPEKRIRNVLKNYPSIEYLTADLLSDDVNIQMDITDIQFPDDWFDVIICNHVLEHIVDDTKAMHELYRTLKPKGWAILQVPVSKNMETTYEDFSIKTESERENVFGQKDHVRIYGSDYPKRLRKAGFDVEVFRWADAPDEFGGRRNLYGLNREEVVFCCYKYK